MTDKKKIILLSILGTLGVLVLEFGMVWAHEYNLKNTIIGMLWLNLWIGAFCLTVGSFAAIGMITNKEKDKEDD